MTNYKTAADLHNDDKYTCWDIMQEDIDSEGLTCIDTSILEDCLLCRNDSNNKVHFIYSTDYENTMIFNFSLLSEVGKPYQQTFRELISRNGYKLNLVETENDYYEIIVKK